MSSAYFESAEVSDVGRKRKNNEDACLRLPDKGLFCVADGMGGVAGGDLASETITTTLLNRFKDATGASEAALPQYIELLRRAANEASKWIKGYAEEKVIGQMGSTIVVLLFDPANPRRAVGLHAGDSRLYRFRDGRLAQLTRDHSAVEALAAKLNCDPASLPAKYQNELIRAVGLKESVELERTVVEVLTGDIFLLCSDGLTRMIEDAAIKQVLSKSAPGTLADTAASLVVCANEAGGKDNVTVVLVRMGDLSSFPPPAPEPEEVAVTVAIPTGNAGGETSFLEKETEMDHAALDADDARGDTPQTDKSGSPAQMDTPSAGGGTRTLPALAKPGSGLSVSHSKGRIWMLLIIVLVAGSLIFLIVPWRGSSGTKQRADAVTARTDGTASIVLPVNTGAAAAASAAKQAQDDQMYQAAMVAAAAALRQSNYSLALTNAAEAWRLKQDSAEAWNIHTNADSLLKGTEEKYQLALVAAQAALQQADYSNAIEKVNEVLKFKTDAPTALKIKSDAERLKAVIEKYQAAMREAGEAWARKDTNALAPAQIALQLKPQDSAAEKLVAEVARVMVLNEATAAFARCDYSKAQGLSKPYADKSEFKELLLKTQEEMERYSKLKARFEAGDYSFLAEITGGLAGKPCFQALEKLGRGEKAQLDQLLAAKSLFAVSNTPANWKAVTNGLSGLPKKTPFAEVVRWAGDNEPVRKLDTELATLSAMLGVAMSPGSGPLTNLNIIPRLPGVAGAAEVLRPRLARLRNDYDTWSLRSQDRSNNLVTLEKAIEAWDLDEPGKPDAAPAPPKAVPGTNALHRLEIEFEKLLVWFNVKVPKGYLKTSEARKEKAIDGEIGPQRDVYLQKMVELETELGQGEWLKEREHARYLKELQKAIEEWP